MMPPLPERDINQTFDWSYTPKQMIEYGKACRAQALAEAAELCRNEQWDHQESANSIRFIDTYNDACDDCAKAIGRLV